jgi:1-acyl-sn-glycerol-3-phosphate acyltransferase
MIVSLVVFATILVLAIPSALILLPFTLVTGNVNPLYATGCFITRIAIRVGGIRVNVEGREHVPDGRACIFMANHVSNLDPPALLTNLPGRTSVFIKRSLLGVPLLGYAFRLAGFIATDRDGRVESAQQSVAQAAVVLAGGIHITTFVEGRRSVDGHLLPFKKGPFYLAMDSSAPCIPVSIYGSERIIPFGSLSIHPGAMHIVFHPPLNPADYATRDELSSAIRAAIASALPDWMHTPESDNSVAP